MIPIGKSAQASLNVRAADTAQALSLRSDDDFPPVFATSRMIALMEIAAARVLSPLLQPGQLSVGVGLQIQHSAATAIGQRVHAIATLQRCEGQLFHFRIEAFDTAGLIGSGEHARAIVGSERLLAGARRRGEVSQPTQHVE